MADVDAPHPRAPGGAGGWRPREHEGRLWIGASRNQRLAFVLRWTLLTQVAIVLLNVAVAGVRGRGAFSPLLYLGAVVVALAGFWWGSGRVGMELGPATVLLSQAFGRRSRTLRWSGVLVVEVDDDEQVTLTIAGEPPISAMAPVGRRWGVTDPDFDAKADTIIAWWRDRRGRAPEVAARLAARETARPGSRDASPSSVEVEPENERFPTGVLLALFGCSVVIGYLFTGPTVLVLAFALLVLLRFGRDPARPLALAAFLLLVVAAITTIVPEPLEPNLTYASRRTIAAEAGAILGVFLVLATLIFAVTERAPDPAPRRAMVSLPGRERIVAALQEIPLGVRLLLPASVLVVGAAALRFVLAPGGLPAAYDPLLRNIRLGNNYSIGPMNGPVPSPYGVRPTGLFAPLAPSLAAFSPFGPRLLLLGASVVLVALVGWVTYRRFGAPAAAVAMAVAAVSPSMWGQQLPNTLAAAAVLVGVALATPDRLNGARAFGAGIALGVALLARPDTVLAAVVVAAWIVAAGRTGTRRRLVPLAVGGLLVGLPWLTFIWTNFGFPRLAETLGATFNDPSAATRLPGFIGLVVGAASVAALLVLSPRLGDRREVLPYLLLPVLCLVLTLTDFPARDPLTWSAPLLCVALGASLVTLLPAGVRRRLGEGVVWPPDAEGVGGVDAGDEVPVARVRAGT